MATVLVIEDNPYVRDVFRRVLEGAGHRVVEAADGAAGVQAFYREPPDVTVCDLYLPGLDGLGVLRQLRQARPGAKVVVVSGGGDGEWGDQLRAAELFGAAEALAKPFGPARLLGAVDRALGA
jgi:CheY-like chemotaxis protein